LTNFKFRRGKRKAGESDGKRNNEAIKRKEPERVKKGTLGKAPTLSREFMFYPSGSIIQANLVEWEVRLGQFRKRVQVSLKCEFRIFQERVQVSSGEKIMFVQEKSSGQFRSKVQVSPREELMSVQEKRSGQFMKRIHVSSGEEFRPVQSSGQFRL
jgi:hypothetical protein